MKSNYFEKYEEGKKISEDLVKFLDSTKVSTLEKFPEVEQWLVENEFSEDVMKNLSNNTYIERSKIDAHSHVANAQKLMKDIQRIGQIRRQRIVVVSLSTVAALLILSFLVWRESVYEGEMAISTIVSQQQCDYDQPTLILNNGTIITLAENMPYENEVCTTLSQEIGNKYNTLMTPKMCTYTITLSDSSQITLNANSELIYPVVFDGENREVILKGEAYFKVAKSKIPFVVKGENGLVTVYGTEFNVNLRTQSVIETILVHGSVGVSSGSITNSERIIQPNQQIVLNTRSGECIVQDVDVERQITWMSGLFKCDSEHLTSLLKEISNWYDVQFEYERALIDAIVVSSSIPRKTPLDELLQLIEINGNVKFIQKKRGVYEIKRV